MSETHRLGALQLAIMRVLWEQREATVASVHSALHAERGLALTTIATMLRKMEAKGVVDHRAEGRQFIYRPLVPEHEIRSNMLGELTERLFLGDTAALVSHLLDAEGIEPAELDRLKELIAAKEEELREND